MNTEFVCSAAAKPTRMPARDHGGLLEYTIAQSTVESTFGLGITMPHAPTNEPPLQAPGIAPAPTRAIRPAQRDVHAASAGTSEFPRLVLRGDPAVLRQLRAAEMAWWEASDPDTRAEAAEPESNASARMLRQSRAASCRTETLLLLTLGAAAGVGVAIGVVDVEDLLAAWGRFTSGIERLLF